MCARYVVTDLCVGGYPIDYLFRNAEEELAEFEYMEFGGIGLSSAGTGDGGGGLDGTADGPGEDDALYKRTE